MKVFAYRTKAAPFAAALALGLVTGLAACAAEDGDPGPEGNPPAAAPGDGSAPTLSVTEPTEGATVTVPFEVSVESTAELGAIDAELHHLHIWFGDTSGQPLIVEAGNTMVEGAPDGETTMIVQVHTFDHVPASDQVSVPLMVQGGGDAPGDGPPPPGNDY